MELRIVFRSTPLLRRYWQSFVTAQKIYMLNESKRAASLGRELFFRENGSSRRTNRKLFNKRSRRTEQRLTISVECCELLWWRLCVVTRPHYGSANSRMIETRAPCVSLKKAPRQSSVTGDISTAAWMASRARLALVGLDRFGRLPQHNLSLHDDPAAVDHSAA